MSNSELSVIDKIRFAVDILPDAKRSYPKDKRFPDFGFVIIGDSILYKYSKVEHDSPLPQIPSIQTQAVLIQEMIWFLTKFENAYMQSVYLVDSGPNGFTKRKGYQVVGGFSSGDSHAFEASELTFDRYEIFKQYLECFRKLVDVEFSEIEEKKLRELTEFELRFFENYKVAYENLNSVGVL